MFFLLWLCLFDWPDVALGDWEKHLLENFFFQEIEWLLLLAGGVQNDNFP